MLYFYCTARLRGIREIGFTSYIPYQKTEAYICQITCPFSFKAGGMEISHLISNNTDIAIET